MNWLHRLALNVLLLTIFQLVEYPSCDAWYWRNINSVGAQTDFESILAQMRAMSNKPAYQVRFLDSNVTAQLAAAQYMINLYNNLTRNNSIEDDTPGFNVANITSTNKTVDDADTIMGILNDVDDNVPKSSSPNMRFKFNFTVKMKNNESVEVAEFHIYKDKPKLAWMKHRSLLVELFIVTIPGNPVKLEAKIQERIIKGSDVGWQIFDVTKTVDIWTMSPGNNYGLELKVTQPSDVLQSIHVNASKFGFVGFKGAYEKRPFIVSFFKGDPTERTVIMRASRRRRRSVFESGNLNYASKPVTRECDLQALYVNFRELGWHKWIIAPDGYDSHYCDGECEYHVMSPRNATNHAIVQTLVNLHNPYTVPKPCCAPTKLNAISVLYYDKTKNVVLKKFKDMVVKSCGCH